MRDVLIVSRHKAAVEFILKQAGLPSDTPVKESVTAEEVKGKVVYGNLPLHLASMVTQVVAIEFSGTPPRGQEYTLAEMEAAGASLQRYTVQKVAEPLRTIKWSDGIRSRGRISHLFFGSGQEVHCFAGKAVPGILAVLSDHFTKNGKWSHTDYTLQLANGAWYYAADQSWEEGEFFHDCKAVKEVIQEFRKAGCTASDKAILECLERRLPKTMERIRHREAEIASVI